MVFTLVRTSNCDNLIDGDFEDSGMIQWINIKVIKAMTIMHEIKEINFLHPISVS